MFCRVSNFFNRGSDPVTPRVPAVSLHSARRWTNDPRDSTFFLGTVGQKGYYGLVFTFWEAEGKSKLSPVGLPRKK